MKFQDAVSAAYEGELTIGGIAHSAVDGLIANFRDPAYRAEFFTAAGVAAACGRARLPFIPSMVISVAAGKAARWAYESVEDIRAKVTAPPQLLFHGVGCPGHTTGLPADCCMGESDAAGGV